VVKILPSEDPSAVGYGVLSSLFLLGAYGVSKALTSYQEKSIHSQFKLLKIRALENDLLEQSHLDLFGFSKQNQSEITKQVISRQTAENIAAMKSEGEVQLDHLNGQLQGQLSLKGHQLQLSELDKETAKNNLETLETNKKIDKLSGRGKPDDTPKLSPNEELKNTLIDALKQHENGWLWTVIDSMKPLILIGAAGSGKTDTTATIALIRNYCLNSTLYYIIDRHFTGENKDTWKHLTPDKIAETEDDISGSMAECGQYWLDRIKQKPKNITQVICDEYTSLRSLVGEISDTFFKLMLSDTRKAKCQVIIITHNATNASFPEGTAGMRKAGTILLNKFSADSKTPLPRVVVRHGLVDSLGNELEDVEHTLPVWFRPAKIHNHFNGKPINFEE
jgi:hypothetical protein